MIQPEQAKVSYCGDKDLDDALAVDIAQQHILNSITSLSWDEYETLELRQSLDRVLAENVFANTNVPAFRNSAMDGYAFANESINLNAQGKIELEVVGSSFAGHPFTGFCAVGQCIRIMTGAMMPDNTDTVIPQELVEPISPTVIAIARQPSTGDNVRAIGEYLQLGQIVLSKGKRLTPADLGLLASLGHTNIKVLRKVKVAILTTGDELQNIGSSLAVGQIYDSNRYTLYGMLSQLPCQINDLGIVADNPTLLANIIQSAADNHDLIIASGGVSVGEADYIRQVLSEIGSINFWKVAMKPGRPLTFGRVKNAWFFGLPGNPVSLMVNFNLFVQAAICQLSGEASKQALLIKAKTTSNLKKSPGRREYQRGILSQNADGSFQVSKTGNQGSAILLSMSTANCFIVLNPEQTNIAVDSEVLVQPFSCLL